MRYIDGYPYEMLKIRKDMVILCVTLLDLFWASQETYVYLVHFHEPIVRSNGVEVKHYVGSTIDPGFRFWQHEHNVNGSKLIKEANRRGIIWTVPIMWKAGREFEQKLKREKHLARHCPLCTRPQTNDVAILTDESPF